MLTTLRGFKDFVLRGNVIDLSVGIVIGAAFTGLVTSFTTAFIKPLLQLFHANGHCSTRVFDSYEKSYELAFAPVD